MALEGQNIITDDVSGTVKPGDLITRFLSAAIDVERAERLALIGDAATVNSSGVAMRPSEAEQRGTPALDTLRALTPLQLGGLAIAGGLTYALVTGKFRR